MVHSSARRGLVLIVAQVADRAARALRGARDAHIAAMQQQPVMGARANSGGVGPDELDFHGQGCAPGGQPGAVRNAKDRVSTAIVVSPKAILSTTFAVLRPTPGNASSDSRSAGTCPPCRLTRRWHNPMRLAALCCTGQRSSDMALPHLPLRRAVPAACWPPGTVSRSRRSRSCRWCAPRASRLRAVQKASNI